jgi:acyl-CoA reductase-like NAD-dependent aldehyde dehydrogenase
MNVQNAIGGSDAAGQRTFERRDPVTGDVASTAIAASVEDARAAAQKAGAAFAGWAATGPSARRALLNKAADILEAKTPDFIEAMTAETGATGPWGGFNCHLAAGHLREAAAMTTSVTGETIPGDKPAMLAMSVRKPKGVCLGIAPWNAPVILGVRAIAAPLACGNTVILKGSEACPKTHQLIVDCFTEAGLPDGVVTYISNAPEDAADVVKALIEAPEVKHVNFTGSTSVGRIIGGLAGAALKPALLELGGKAPLI